MPLASSPIGVFDSGVGGLSVLRALLAAMPNERFIYLADSGNAPYGERGDAFVTHRTHAITDYLQAQFQIKALVVACNTATAAAIHEVRARHPALPLIGVEPALKPAVALSQTKHIGVLATRGTLASGKFAKLRSSLESQAEFVVQPCDGLAHAIERSVAWPEGPSHAGTETYALCERYLKAMNGRFGREPGSIDTLVLGCTHYVFVKEALAQLAGPNVHIIETGDPVARHTRHLLETAHLQAPRSATELSPGDRVQLLTTGSLALLKSAAARWLQLPDECCQAIELH